MANTYPTAQQRNDSAKPNRTPKQLHTLSRFWRLLSHYLRPQWPRMLVLGLTLTATIGIQLAGPLLAARFIDAAISDGTMRTLVILALATLALAVLGQGVAIVETWAAEHVSWTATNAMRVDLLAHLLRLDRGFHTANTPGALIERVDGDVGTLARFFSRFVVYVLGNIVLLLAVLVLLFIVDWRLGVGLSIFVAIGLVAMLTIRARAMPAWTAERRESAGFYGFLGEYLAGTEDLGPSGARHYVLRRCAAQMRQWFAADYRAGMWGYTIMATSRGLLVLGTAVAFLLSAMLYRDGTLTIGTVYLVVQYTNMLRRPIEQLRNEVQDLQQADAGLGRVEELLATAPALVDGTVDRLPVGPLDVQLDGVTFAYAGDQTTLHDVSLQVPAGRVLGIVGRTGSGKTTLTRLMARFHDPDAGVVRLGGVNLREVQLAAVRARIGLVTQDVHLFNASVRANLTLFDDSVSEARLIDVLDAIGLGDWLAGLPHGLDTPLGLGGVGLSVGQAQLLACARVFLQDPDLVILDEASSRLDPATERLLQGALARLLAGRTGVMIAHRLATLEFADDILVMENGRVLEHGPRAALIADPHSRFATLLRTAAEEALV